ncbi:MAG: hypothetical protein WC879_06870 [Melioribacteraceae bacterium]
MLDKKQYQSSAILILISFFLFFSTVVAQCESKETKLQVSLKFFPIVKEYTALEYEIENHFLNALKSKNIQLAFDANWELVISVKEITEKEEIVISVTQMAALPEKVIEIAAENEVFYKDVSDTKKFPPEGKEIRQMISREFIFNFREAKYNQIIITEKSKLKDACENIINSFFNLRFNNSQQM